MFVLTELKEIVRILPSEFGRSLNDAIADELNIKLANKVLLNVGLCIALFDISKLGDSHVLPGDGASHTETVFRVVVFRPFLEEIIVGKVKSCGREGIHVTLGFFDDIIIPATAMPHPSRFDDIKQAWAWEYSTEDGHRDLFIYPDEEIRFRVTEEIFVDTAPPGVGKQDENQEKEKQIPYTIRGSISESGLGPLAWWKT